MFGGMLIYRGLSLSRNSITSDFPAKKQVLISFGFFVKIQGKNSLLTYIDFP